MAGSLYLVATPIGNLEDITLRALRVLREEVTVVACEDTRQTRKLLEHFQIQKPLISCHEHNEESRATEIIQILERGESVAIVSDAGTPLISDPGYRVVTAALEKSLQVIPVPGASAIMAALAASGLSTNEFRFVGFLPYKTLARRRMLASIAGETATIVAYESPHRIGEALKDMAEILGDRPLVLARELTKVHEEFLRGSASQIRERLGERDAIKGEITLVISHAEVHPESGDPSAEVTKLQEAGMERMEAIKTIAKRMRLPKRQVYQLAATDNNRRDKRRD